MRTERRRAPRVEILGQLHGRLVLLESDVSVREISLGGMSVESAAPFPVGSVQHFQLVLGDGARVIVAAEARHSRPVEGASRYVTGFRFVEEPNDGEALTVPGLIDKLT